MGRGAKPVPDRSQTGPKPVPNRGLGGTLKKSLFWEKVTFWGGPPAETRDGPYKEITIVKARFLRFTGGDRETAKSELLDGLGRFGRSQAGSALGPSKPGKVRFPASPGQGCRKPRFGQGPQTRPQGGLPRCPKGGSPNPTFGPQAHYRPDGLLGPFPEPRFRDRSQGVLPKVGSGLETSVLDTLGLGRQTQTGGGCPELRLENPRSTLEGTPKRTPSEDPILRSV